MSELYYEHKCDILAKSVKVLFLLENIKEESNMFAALFLRP